MNMQQRRRPKRRRYRLHLRNVVIIQYRIPCYLYPGLQRITLSDVTFSNKQVRDEFTGQLIQHKTLKRVAVSRSTGLKLSVLFQKFMRGKPVILTNLLLSKLPLTQILLNKLGRALEGHEEMKSVMVNRCKPMKLDFVHFLTGSRNLVYVDLIALGILSEREIYVAVCSLLTLGSSVTRLWIEDRTGGLLRSCIRRSRVFAAGMAKNTLVESMNKMKKDRFIAAAWPILQKKPEIY